MIDYTIISFVAFGFMILGIIGSIIPVIPGPIMSYIGLLLIHFFTDLNFTDNELVRYGIITVLVFASDYILQFLGVNKMGGKKYAVYGTMIGVSIGLFFPPIGLILGPFIGAFMGALLEKNSNRYAFKIAFGALLGFVFGTIIKLSYSLYILYLVINKLSILNW